MTDVTYSTKNEYSEIKESDISGFSACMLVIVVFFFTSVWGSALFGLYGYYFHPLINTFLIVIFTIIALMAKSWKLAPLALVVYVGASYGIADSLLFNHHATSRWLSWGIFQIHDASDFLSRTAQFLVNGTFETHRGRVINILTYAALLDWNDFNTVASTRVLTFLAAVSTALTTLIVSKKWGVVSGAVFAYIIVEFANGHIGGVSSEMPGLIFGLLAFCFLLSVSQRWSGTIFLFGLLSLCFSLLIRVGAVFILPALIIWAWHALQKRKMQKWLITVTSLLMVAGLIVFDSKLTNMVAPKSGGSFANAYDSWYAVHVEGQLVLKQRDEASVMPQARWVQIYRDNPNLRELSGKDEVAVKKNILIETFLQSPITFFVGGMQRIGLYFYKFMFAFVEIGLIKGLLTLMACFGLWSCFKKILSRSGEPTDYLLAFGFTAIVLSIPFLYGAESRAIGSTIGFIAGLPATALSRLKKEYADDAKANICSSMRPLISISVVFLVMTCIPVYGYLSAGSWSSKSTFCKNYEQRVYMNGDAALLVGPGSKKSYEQLQLYRDKLMKMRTDNIALRKTSFKVFDYQFNYLIEQVKHLKETARVGYGLDVESGKLLPFLFAAPTEELSEIGCVGKSSKVRGCGTAN